MKLPPSLDSRFEAFVQALPEDYQQQAYDFKAFTRGRKIRSPLQLLRLVMLYCGLDYRSAVVPVKWHSCRVI